MSPPASRRNHVPQSTPSEPVSIRRDEPSQKQLPKAGCVEDVSIGCVLGIDASLSGTGLVSVPLDWGQNWNRVASKTVGFSLPLKATTEQKIARLSHIVSATIEFAKEHRATIAAIEAPAFGRTTASFALGEISGALKVALSLEGFEVVMVPISSARKLLLGHVPRKAAKLAVRTYLVTHGAHFGDNDQADAFCAANWALAKLAGKALDEAS